MSEEVLIPKMKRLDKKQKKIKIPVLNFLLILFCTLLIVASTFINIDIKHYTIPFDFMHGGKNYTSEDFITCFSIIPQVPVVMFICSFLGKRMAIMSAAMYILAGLTIFPIFALGGGISYIAQYSFGYILAYIPAIIACATIIKKNFSFMYMFLGALSGVLIIHMLGMTYMALIALVKQDGFNFIQSWISAQSGLKIIYDIIGSYIFIIIGRYFNSFLKFIRN